MNNKYQSMNEILEKKLIERDTVGIKYDQGKPLIADFIRDFKEPLIELCKIYEFGRTKYGRNNFKELENGQERFENALIRHFLKEGSDEETNISHTAHIAYNALMVLWYELEKRD